MRNKVWTKNKLKELTYRVMGCAMEVHKFFGPGLLEENYEDCLVAEFTSQGINYQRQLEVEVIYKQVKLPRRYRLDLLVEDVLVVELKSVKQLMSIHEAQLLTYLKLTQKPKGLLINFNTKYLEKGVSWIPLVNRNFSELEE